MDFSMTDVQRKAFQDATNMGANNFLIAIVFLLAFLAIVWLIAIFIGSMRNDKLTVYEGLAQFSVGVCVFIAVGSLIYYV